MARQNDNTELVKRLVSIEMVIPQTGTVFDQTTAGSTAKDSATITVPATTNATAGDPLFIIGSNGIEVNKINGAPVAAMPLTYKTAFLHPAGTRVLEAQILPLGRVEVNGFTLSPSQSETIIEAADIDTAVQTVKGTLELSYSFSLLGFNAQNLLNALGYGDNESGTGTSADPRQSTVGDGTASVLGIVAFRLTLLRYDLKTVTMDFTNCSIAPQGTIQMGAKSGASSIPFQGKCSYIVRREWL